MFRYSLFSLLLFPIIVSANTMSQSFNEGRDIGRSNNSGAQNAVKQISPNEFQGYKTPEQSKHYTGITGAEPNINVLGMQEMSRSEVGQTIRTSTINNPKDKIAMDSDMIQRSFEINKNAKAIAGVNGKQCVKQVMRKTTFTSHYCEKDQSIKRICYKTANVKWTGSRSVENKEIRLTYNNGFVARGWNNGVRGKAGLNFEFSLPVDAIITGYDYHFRNNQGWFGLEEMYFDLFGHSNAVYGNSYAPVTVNVRNLNIPVKAGDIKTGTLGNTTYLISLQNRLGRFMETTTHYIQLYYKVEVDTLKPEIEWQYSCPNMENDNVIEVGKRCTQEGGFRNFLKDGKNFQLYSDCWQEQTEYLVSDSSDNECKRYDENPNCTVGERECIAKEGNDCVRHKIKYQCANTTKTDGYVCGDQFFCSDGSCSDLEGSVNTDFGHAVSQLATLAQAGKDIGLDEQNMKAFSGKPMFCRKSGFGFSDCCKDSGWGHKVGLAKCNVEENALGRAKEKNLVIYTGTFCSKRVLKKCVQRKSSYCVFDNKLARIVQYQGRSGQLGIGFGDAKNPNCRGLSIEELQGVNFNVMDYSDFYQELEERQAIPDKNQLIDYMKNTITEQLQQE